MDHKESHSSGKRKNISRRNFINYTATGTAMIALKPVTKLMADDTLPDGGWPGDAPDFRFHMIGHGHIDPVWLWPWSEGVSIVHSTFRSALDRMNETPGFIFSASSALFYQWVAENDPSMLEEIRKRVDEGRWNIVGGWWVEPDMNIPCGEAMVRQGLYGQLTFQRLLGHRAKVAFNPDAFGHANTLPQILKLQGMDNYIFMRPRPDEKTLPADLFWWEGADGTLTLTSRIPIGYNDKGSVRNRIETILSDFRDQRIKRFMSFYGVGDHGGGATRENLRSIEELKFDKNAPAVFFSSVDSYFEEIRSAKNIDIPVVKDDLQHHAVGCYTADSEIKKRNQQSEVALCVAEKIAALGSVIWGCNYPKREFNAAWRRVLFLQFHDSLAGTSLPEHSQFAWNGFGRALDIAHQGMYMAVQKLEWQIAAEDPESQYLLAFNPHSWEVRENISCDFHWERHEFSLVEDEQGHPLPSQWAKASIETGNRKKLIVNVTIPAMGYRQIRLKHGAPIPVSNGVKVGKTSLENEILRIDFSDDGTIGIFDKENRKNVFENTKGACRAVVIDDPSDTWSHGVKSFSNEIGTFGKAVIKLLENGPLQAKMRVQTTYGNSVLAIDWKLCAGSRNLEAEVTLDWHEHLKMLKFSFPVGVESPVSTYETPYGHIVRPVNGDENPGQRWFDLSGQDNGKSYGLTIINDAKYGYSVLDNDMRISVARSAVYAHHAPMVLDMNEEHIWMDQGIHTFRMLLFPHADTWRENNVVRISQGFIAPLITIYQGIHGGTMPKANSFLTVNVPNVNVAAIKLSETGEDIILRCIESSGKPAIATINLKFVNLEWTGHFRPLEIKTLRLDRHTGEIKEVDLLEENN